MRAARGRPTGGRIWREQGKGAPVPERPGTCDGVAVVVSVQGPAGGMLAVGDIQIHAPSLSGHGHAYAIGQRRQSGQHARVARRADRGDPVWPAAAGRGAGGVLARLGAGRWQRGHAGGTGGAAAACGPGAGRSPSSAHRSVARCARMAGRVGRRGRAACSWDASACAAPSPPARRGRRGQGWRCRRTANQAQSSSPPSSPGSDEPARCRETGVRPSSAA